MGGRESHTKGGRLNMPIWQADGAYRNPMMRPVRACHFSGCPYYVDRRVGKYDLCRKHADNLERSRHEQVR